MAALRADLVFSYWVFIWYLLYISKITKYSPKFVIILGLIDNAIMLALMLLYGTSRKTIFYFILINTLIKVLPYYYLRNEKIQIRDIYCTLALFSVFVVWLYINNQSLIGNSKLIYESLLYGQNKTPFMDLLEKVKKNYKNFEVL